MKLIGGRLFLDFVNTVDGRANAPARGKSQSANSQVTRDKLGNYFDLVEWGLHSGILTATVARKLIQESKQRPTDGQAVLERALALREALYRICKATMTGRSPQNPDLKTLNDELLEARSHERLIHAGNGFTWEWVGNEAALDRMLWPIASSGAQFLNEGDLSRLRECSGEDCGWVFEDTSRNRSRQWCDMQDCGNLAKVRRFRKRLRKRSAIKR